MHDISTPSEHYANLLSDIYSWDGGGAAAQIAALSTWLEQLPLPPAPGTVLDLGCGFGAAAIPLARRGYDVVAVDTSEALLAELREHAGSLNVRPQREDLLMALQQRSTPVAITLCLGDTLTHLDSHADVEALLAGCAARLSSNGIAVLSYRSSALEGAQRFILVKADEQRTHTCFIEKLDEQRNAVWDLVHERRGTNTELRVSGYPKLRLDPEWVAERARAARLSVESGPPFRGMIVQILRRLES